MNSTDKQFTSHSIIAVESIGLSGSYQMIASTVPDYRMPFFLSYNKESKSACMLEQIFTGIGSKSGQNNELVGVPFINSTSPSYTDKSVNSLSSRFNYGVTLSSGDVSGVNKSVGLALPMYAAGFGYDINGYFVPSNKTVAITSINNSGGKLLINRPNHYLLSGNSISINKSLIPEYNQSVQVIKIVDTDNFIVDVTYTSGSNLSYPNTGRYEALNLDLYSPSGATNPDGYISTIQYTDDIEAWKAGPVDLRWDESRQVWCGSDFFRSDIIWGYLASDIKPAFGRNDPTPFKINTYKQSQIPIYIVSFEEDNSITNGGTIINLVPNNLAMVNGDSFVVVNSNTSYDGTHTLISHSDDYTQLIIADSYDSGANSNVSDIGYIAKNIYSASGTNVSRVLDKQYIAYNYDTHLSVQLVSKCLNISGGCVTVEDDIFVGAIKKGGDIRAFYIGFGDSP
jgi:hypothetical protein